MKIKTFFLFLFIIVSTACSTQSNKLNDDDQTPSQQPIIIEENLPLIPTKPSDDKILIYIFTDEYLTISNSHGESSQHILLPSIIDGPSLSPNGQTLAYFYEHNLYLHDIATNTNEKANQEMIPGFLSSSVWSPDGQQLAFDCMPSNTNRSEICLFTIANGEIQILTDAASLGAKPNDGVGSIIWRDPHFMIFSLSTVPEGHSASVTTIYRLALPSLETHVLLNEQENLVHIAPGDLLSDHQHLLFTAKAGNQYAIFQLNLDGTGLKRITPASLPYNVTDPIVSPDGLSFYAYAPNVDGIGVPTLFAIDGTQLSQLSTIPGKVFSWVSLP